MCVSKLDHVYRSIILSKYFTKGWGSPETLKRLIQFKKIFSRREKCLELLENPYPINITKDKISRNIRIIEGDFHSPFDIHLPALLPKESKTAYFQMIFPKQWSSGEHRPVCIHFAATGDHYFWRRRHVMAKPLLKEAGIGAILLENPFYGNRRPVSQVRSILNNVSDIFVMGGCLILEGLVLLQWCQREGLGPLGVTGISMGGHMASLVATNWPHPLVLVPCLSSSTGSGVFTEGVMSKAINWNMLESQFQEDLAYRSDVKTMFKVRESDAFQAGQEFVKNFPKSMINLDDKDLTPPTHMDGNVLSRKDELIFINNKSSDSLGIEKKVNEILELSDPMKKTKGSFFSPFFHESLHSNEAINFMRGIMDECTHLKNYSVPVDTSLIISVCARDDAYVPNRGISCLSDLWPGAEVRYINAGHVSGFLLYQKEFRKAIVDAYTRCLEKYH